MPKQFYFNSLLSLLLEFFSQPKLKFFMFADYYFLQSLSGQEDYSHCLYAMYLKAGTMSPLIYFFCNLGSSQLIIQIMKAKMGE